MTPQDEKKWRDLCHQAMNQNDVTQLLKIFLELDRAAEREQRTEIFSEAVREHRQIGLDHPRIKMGLRAGGPFNRVLCD